MPGISAYIAITVKRPMHAVKSSYAALNVFHVQPATKHVRIMR